MKAFKFEGDNWEKIVEIEIPADHLERANSLREEMIEKVASADDALMEKFFETGDLTVAEIKSGLRKAICNNELYAITCGSALQNIWVQLVIDAAVEFLPSPLDVNNWMLAVKDIDSGEVKKE